MRTHNPSVRQRRQRKCVLNELSTQNNFIYRDSFLKRHYSYQVNSGLIKIDASVNNTSRQDVRDKKMENQRDLKLFKKEILSESDDLTPLLIKSINKGIWPMLKFHKEIWTLVKKRQKYLAMLSNQYGFRSAAVINQIDEWLTKLDLRVFAIETVYRFSGNFTSRVDNLILKRKILCDSLEMLKYNNLKHYKPDQTCRVYIPKGKNDKRPLKIPTIKDRIVQTLFVQLTEPIIDIHADNLNFGFRKGRNPHQAIGLLSKLLQIKPAHHKHFKNEPCFVHSSKYILHINIKKFFDNVNRNWLLKNYPFPNNFINILKKWLAGEIVYHSEYEIPVTEFLQGSAIGPSLINFTLNGLEKLAIPNKVTNKKKFDYYKTKSMKYHKSFSVVKQTFTSSIIRYADDIIVVVHNQKEAEIINQKINNFLQKRGLNKNFIKSKIFKWENNVKFDYLGFTFHYILGKKFSKITAQRKLYKNFIWNGLYIYPSKFKVQLFKNWIKATIKSNLNVSPYRLINILNPILKSWGNYFGIGTLKTFSRLDYFIWYRLWRYLRRKYWKVSTQVLVKRYFQGIKTPSGKKSQFHGTFNSVDKDTVKRKSSVTWLLLLAKLNKPVPVDMFAPSNSFIKATFYTDELPFIEYNLKIIKLRSTKKSVDKINKAYCLKNNEGYVA